MWNRTYTDTPRKGFSTTLSFSDQDLVSISVDAIGTEVMSGELFREVRVAELSRKALAERFPTPVDAETIARIKGNPRRTDESMAVALALHDHASATGRAPAKFVQETLGLPPATAGRWVAAARTQETRKVTT